LYPKINWNSGKALAVAVGVGIPVPGLPFGFNIGTDYMAHIWSVKCIDYFQKLAPYCEAVVLFMTPPLTVPLIMKVAVMRSFMKAWCPTQTGILCMENRKCDSILCSETSKIEAGTSTLLFIEENVNDQMTTRVRDVDEVWGEIVSLWAKLGTEMMDVFQAALKIGRNIGKMADKVQTEFLAMAKSAEEVVDKWLAKHVGKRLDALRAHFGDVKPEDQPDKHFSIPSGEGVYIKIKDCGELADEDGETLEAPYFDCYPYEENQKKSIRRRLLDSKGFFGDDDDNDLDDDQKKTTEIGEHKGPDKSRYYFDWNEDEEKSGYGVWLKNSVAKCVKCLLRERKTLGWDTSFGNDDELDDAVSLTVCSGSHEKYEAVPFEGPEKSTKGSSCEVLYKDQRSGK